MNGKINLSNFVRGLHTRIMFSLFAFTVLILGKVYGILFPAINLEIIKYILKYVQYFYFWIFFLCDEFFKKLNAQETFI